MDHESERPGRPFPDGGHQWMGVDGVWNITGYIDHDVIHCALPVSDEPAAVRADLCLSEKCDRPTLIKIGGKCSNLVVSKCCNVSIMLDEISSACCVSESEHVSVIIRYVFPSPITARSVQGLLIIAGQNNIHCSVSASRAMGFEIHGVVKPGQSEPPFAQVSTRMPNEMWAFEDLFRAKHGKVTSSVPADGVVVLQCGRITKCADITNTACLNGEPCLMFKPRESR